MTWNELVDLVLGFFAPVIVIALVLALEIRSRRERTARTSPRFGLGDE